MKKYLLASAVVALSVFEAVILPHPVWAGDELPPAGLSDSDPMVRFLAVQEVKRKNIRSAEDQVAKMAKEDPFADVREAACKALQDLKAAWQINLLSDIAESDPDISVRNAAEAAVQALQHDMDHDTELHPSSEDATDYRPTGSSLDSTPPETRHLAVGVGIMGGYGVISATLRGRIGTGIKYMPWIGIEVGVGWTPPPLYVVTAGPVDKIDSEDRWKIVSAAGALLLYPHRLHYAAIRGGFDIGRGGYAMIGYGFEMLNDEGFISWGLEAGLLIQPAIESKIKRLTTCDEEHSCESETWPVAPFVRFSVHLYPI